MASEMRVENPRVLMVDDEKKVADAYALRLEGVGEVTVAYGGEEALTVVGEQLTPDVVLLDRHMPGLSGDEVLDQLRGRDLKTRVVMVTAIDPGLDIVDMPFDDYLSKPVDREDLHAAVDQQCQVLAYELLGEYFRLESTRAVIDAELPAGEVAADDRLADIEARRNDVKQRVLRLLPETEELLSEFSGIDRERY
ncbi:response regulator [Halostagnicola kamekurae]|uniref:Response regulator receiver domain-containing protein n=1 Tax=Halostagnicola kamekurae TaxID=619731 RepID=A0A1I6TSW3_9EURY|nr:Response regulator receiver domain-containing protein [Halostagnicola kamekurae]